jgi:replication-associated recombination protein RarA
MASLFEQYRPSTWGDVVGQEKIKKRVEIMRSHGGLGGNAFWLQGKSGSGKTTIARLLAAEVADGFAIEEIDASKLTADEIERRHRMLCQRVLGTKGGWALIINEAHGLNANQVRRLLTLLEPDGGLPEWVVFIFTTTNAGQQKLFDGVLDAGPLLSRCIRFEMEERGQNPLIARKALEIAQAEGLDGKPESAYMTLANEHRGNWRGVLTAIKGGEMLV